DAVKNANEVKFVGTTLATVTGATVDGVRTITVDVNSNNVGKNIAGDVKVEGNKAVDGSPNTLVAMVNGQPVEVVKVGDTLYKKDDIDSTGNPKPNAQSVTRDAGTEVVNNAPRFATTSDVVNAINNSGFTLKTSGNKESGNDEVINPGDVVEMVAGKNLTVKQEANGKVTYSTKDDVQFTSVQLGNNTGPKLTADGNNIKVGDSNGEPVKVTNVADGDISPNSKDAINGSQLYAVKEVAEAGWNLSVNNGENAGKVAPKATVDLNNKDGNINITKDGNNVTFNLAPTVKIGGDNNKVTIDGDKGTIGGLKNTEFDPSNVVSGQAATEDQLKSVYNNLSTSINETGFNLVGKANGGDFEDKSTDKRIGKDDNFTLDAGNNIKVTQIDNGYEVSLKDKIEVTDVQVGEKGADGKPGKDGTVGVNGANGSSVVLNGKDGSIGLTGPKGADGKDGASANISVKDGQSGLDGAKGQDGKDGTEGKTRIVYETKDPNDPTKTITEEVATLNDGLRFDGDSGEEVKRPLNSKLSVKGGQTDKTKLSDNPNIGVVTDPATGTLNVKLAKDVDLGNDGSIQAGGVTINNNGIDAGNKVISNVAPGVKDTDAVNVGQLKGTVNNVANQLNNKINRQGKDLRAGIAGANAAAGLPQVYIPGKSMVAASAGTFKGQSAVAVGYSRASDNGKLILKLQGNANTRGDVGGSVGVGYQW
ncbi:YadA family autotransporter adhesin, partial [Ursidibacter sp. B-7004-1]